jgi:hypothetical protein
MTDYCGKGSLDNKQRKRKGRTHAAEEKEEKMAMIDIMKTELV